MIIKNTTDRATPKVVGIGKFWIEPGQEKDIPDEFLYTDEFDNSGRRTGMKVMLPALECQKRMGMIDYTEKKPVKEEAKEDNADDASGDDEADKKAEAAAKRAATRAANKAAKEAAAE